MSRKSVTRKLLVCALLASALSVGGVCATWLFYEAPPTPTHTTAQITLNEFAWAPEEVLPEFDDVGESHLALVNMIITDTLYGLNKSNSILNNELEKRLNQNKDFLESTAQVSGKHLKHLFTTDATRALEFVIHYINDSLYYIYTLEDDELEKADDTGVVIPVFRTRCEKTNGVWEGVSSEAGIATTMKDVKGKALTIDVGSFSKTKTI